MLDVLQNICFQLIIKLCKFSTNTSVTIPNNVRQLKANILLFAGSILSVLNLLRNKMDWIEVKVTV